MADKKRTEPDWQDIRVFLALGRYGSLSAAARALSTNHSTISRRLQSLEATLGEKLVERRPEGYVLTPAGTHARAAASDMEAAVHTLGRGSADGTPRGLVRTGQIAAAASRHRHRPGHGSSLGEPGAACHRYRRPPGPAPGR
ncbi:hypothetical protein G6F57_020492 [Rhizopus arrhizus]|nr:hypothetical protein G6F57_020492 [Rhizopus arrhizus]